MNRDVIKFYGQVEDWLRFPLWTQLSMFSAKKLDLQRSYCHKGSLLKNM